ncbi:RNA-directed DNA polymerase [Vibrio parahaemolyticus]|uniref:antiviral reverse transcriptase Drt4 n=1 Tax=Vibrio TaxID=662 RepID=UPI00193D3260|nr:antiviral reverse transcriptase Drt4 [Vibrio splendidus]MBM5096068.1 RNA-directed DNA polymerase [Vibrio parahaemolyticus]MBM5418830.1 RNA-directed DNA polymerase [Vibrio parahaemolyticus]MCF9098479.1 RNA-directed DNA polymerase [Vibrio parahaemolyticus]MCF9116539.1 RNA-directed DNA polymerase [Vibrio parahaemolyticus]MDH5936855.1 RNA-directed DNA polymerase [Vibrio splendidus]
MLTINEKRNVYEALTRRNYFPNQKESFSELPPCIDTRQFTPEVCEAISKLALQDARDIHGFDLVEYKATRYNNVPRSLALLHPRAYANLAKLIHDQWDELQHLMSGKNSAIKPTLRQDGRILVMNYDDPLDKRRRFISSSFSKRFKVTADISNCFNSVYTHSIPWAAIGFDEAKTELLEKVSSARKRNNKKWYNKLDKYQRMCKRNETLGVPIGPATSSIVVELILQKIDKKLDEFSFQFERYIDDYVCYCDTSEQAQLFTLELGKLLSKYKLDLNLSKTNIVELPEPTDDLWVMELNSSLPSYKDEDGTYSSSDMISYLNKAVLLNRSTPDGSVLKYAIRSIMLRLSTNAELDTLDYILNLSWHYPILIPYAGVLISQSEAPEHLYLDKLNAIILENAKQLRSDGMAWPLHIIKENGCELSNEVMEAVITSRDCVSMTILHSILETDRKAPLKKFAEEIVLGGNYEKDAYWLLLYQMYLAGDLREDPYDDKVFPKLKQFRVNFLPGEGTSRAEDKCEEIRIEFIGKMFRETVPSLAPILR